MKYNEKDLDFIIKNQIPVTHKNWFKNAILLRADNLDYLVSSKTIHGIRQFVLYPEDWADFNCEMYDAIKGKSLIRIL